MATKYAPADASAVGTAVPRGRRTQVVRSVTIGALRGLVLAGVVVAWEATTGGFGLGWDLFPRAILPQPSQIARDFAEYARSGLLLLDLRTTLTEASLGFLLGTAGGVVVGLVFGYVEVLAAVLEPIMVALNSLPRITVAPIVIVWFGLGIASKVALSLFTVFFVIFFNTYLGMRNVDADLVKAVRVMGGTPRDVARLVILPSVASWIFAALRTSVSFALSGAIVGEFVGSSNGLGYRMLVAAGLLDTPRVFDIMLLLMVVGVTLVGVSQRVERYLLRWRPSWAQMG
jgi:NitT/TauT family transport system permease protein